MAMTEAQLRAQRRYQRRAIAQVIVKLHRERDADILEHLDRQANKNGYIKDLIRADIAANEGANKPANKTNSGEREQDAPAGE